VWRNRTEKGKQAFTIMLALEEGANDSSEKSEAPVTATKDGHSPWKDGVYDHGDNPQNSLSVTMIHSATIWVEFLMLFQEVRYHMPWIRNKIFRVFL